MTINWNAVVDLIPNATAGLLVYMAGHGVYMGLAVTVALVSITAAIRDRANNSN